MRTVEDIEALPAAPWFAINQVVCRMRVVFDGLPDEWSQLAAERREGRA
jgi:hypothetical protein